MRLYGNDIDETTTRARSRPRLDRRLEEGRLHRRRARCASRRRAAPRASSSASRCSTAASRATATPSYVGGAQVGVVTSGTQTPFLKKAIGMAYVPAAAHGAGHRVRRSTSAAGARAARVVPMPFYKRPDSSRSTMAYPADLKYTKDHEWIELDRRPRRRRHHRLRAAAARRRRLRRAAGRRRDGESRGSRSARSNR